MSRVFFLPVRFPRATLLLIFGLTAWLGVRASQIEFDASIESLLPRNDPERVYYENVKKTFGSDQAAVIGVFAHNVFAPSTIAKIDKMSSALRDIAGVHDVLSITTVQGVEVDDFGAIQVGRLMKAVPGTDDEAARLKASIVKNPLYSAHLISKDDRSTGILVLFENLSDAEYSRRGIEARMRAIVTDAGGPETFAVTGMHTVKVAAAELMRQDLLRFIPVSMVVLAAILLWAFRAVRGVVLPLLAVSIGVVWTLGVMSLAGVAINLGTLLLPPLLAAIGIAYVIHIIARYYARVERESSGIDALCAAVDELAVPIALAACTTLVGFGPFAFSPIRAVREFGVFALIGILIVLSVAEVFVPAALVLFPEPRRGRGRYHERHWVSRILTRSAQIAVSHRWHILAITTLVTGLGLWGANRVRVDTDYLTFIDAHHPVRQETKLVTDRLGGTQPLYFVVEGGTEKSLIQLPALAAIRDLQNFIREQPEVDKSVSLIDFLSVVRGALNPEAPPGLPEAQAEVSQLLVFVSPKDLQPVATADFSRANLVVGTHATTSAELRALIQRIEAYAASRFPPEMKLRASGTVAMLNRSADVLARGQLWGLGAVVGTLLVTMSIGLLSVRAGLAAIVPNVVPIIVMFGIMGFGGLTLTISTSMVATISIGIAVADAIHYLSSFNAHLRETGDEESAIRHVGREVGLPIILTSIVLMAGFSVICLSNFPPVRQFGLLAATTMAGALVADLLVLPALVRTAHLVTAWDILRTTVGASPNREIALFEGLRPFQAKIVVLMGKVLTAPTGALITREGERKDELYVLLRGSAEVRRAGTGAAIRTLQRGDVIGEMGLVRQSPRTADVIVAEPAEYFVLDSQALNRIQRRHPRIAATVLRNLTRALSDRLEMTTNELVRMS